MSIMRLVCISISTAVGQSERIVRFPSEVSLGRFFVNESSFMDRWMDWQDVGPARGEVRVSAGMALRLDVSQTGSAHLAALKSLNPDDVQLIRFDFDVNDMHLAQLVDLEGVQILSCYSPNVGDAGLMHISKLTSLIDLNIGRGCFTDEGLRYLANLKFLQRLDLDRTEITDKGLANLKELPSLKSIGLSNCERISDTGISHLAQIKSLERLVMYGGKITGHCFSHFEPNGPLREVLLNHSTITDAGLAHLGKIKSLEKLWLYNTKISDEGILHLQYSSSLRDLTVGETSVSNVGVAALGKVTSLESLYLSSWNTEDVFKDLTGLKHLKELNLTEINYTGAGLGQLREFRALEILWLPPAPKGIDLSFLRELPRLEELFIMKVTLTAQNMNSLSSASSLKRLETSGVRVEEHDYSALGRLTSLEGLFWRADSRNPEHATGDKILKAIAGLKKLQTLYFSGCSPTREGLQLLRTLPSLSTLWNIGISEIADDRERHLGRLTHLKDLHLIGDNIPPGALEQLRGLKSLQELTLYVSETHTGELLPLADLESLRTLYICDLFLEQDSLEHLKTLGTGLQLLTIDADGLNDEEISQIKEQVPNCRVIVPSPRIRIGPAVPPKTRQYPSLVGRKLPELQELGIDIDITQTHTIIQLICFFDMNQRPSRNCIGQLAKRTEQLKEKGIAVIAVQTPKVDEDMLNKWVKKNNVPILFGPGLAL
jgi:Leucine-rich repeat (LRR) protein